MTLYRKKPVEVEAVQYRGTLTSEVEELLNSSTCRWLWDWHLHELKIETLEGLMTVSQYDWIIKGTQGETYPCKPAAFQDTFEEVKSG